MPELTQEQLAALEYARRTVLDRYRDMPAPSIEIMEATAREAVQVYVARRRGEGVVVEYVGLRVVNQGAGRYVMQPIIAPPIHSITLVGEVP